MFGDKARAISNLARETREASRRETYATEMQTQAINKLTEVTKQLPEEIADSMPKYSEREVRALREEIDMLRRQSAITNVIGRDMVIYVCPSLMDFGKFDMRLYFRESPLNFKSVSFDDKSIRAEITPPSIDVELEMHKAIRL